MAGRSSASRPATLDPFALAEVLRGFADRIETLAAYDSRRPHAFHESKNDLAADVIALADSLTARAPPAAAAPRPPGVRRPRIVLFRKGPHG